MPIERVPVVSSFDSESTTSGLTEGSTSSNIIYDRYIDNRPYASQRPAITLSGSVSANPGVDNLGRGVYFWDSANTFIFVNNDTVFSGYPTSIGTITAGKDPVYFAENQTQLVIIDPENNEGWYIDISSPGTLIAISDVDFPPNQTPVKQLAGGVVYLNGFIFVLDTDGIVWNSGLNDITAWDALDFIGASREIDTGVFIGKHHDNVMVVGTKSIEFLYNAGNPVASPLSIRQDVSYRTGCIDRKSIYTTGDIAAFIGTEQSGTLGLYEIKNFQLVKKSNLTLDETFSYLGLRIKYDFILSGSLINDHYITFISPVLEKTVDGVVIWEPIFTIVYDDAVQMWSKWSTTLTGLNHLSVTSVADKTQGTDRTVTMMLTDGNVIQIDGRLEPIDNDGDESYFLDDDYLEDQNDYILLNTDIEEVNIPISLTLPEIDFGLNNTKFGRSLRVIGTSLINSKNSDPLLISWSDDHYNTFIADKFLDVGFRRKLTRLGSFRRRGHRISYSGPDPLRLEAIELNVGVSKDD